MDLSDLPKVELHVHLDCSLSYQVVQQLDPDCTEEDYKSDFIAPRDCTDLIGYLKSAERAINLMQSESALRLVTLDLIEQLANDKVVYAEIRFAPLLHVYDGLTPKEVVACVEKASLEGMEKYEVEVNLILCTLRHYSEQQSMETVQLVQDFKGGRVVGFDIASDEKGFPIDAHLKAFAFAYAKNIPCTAHAGEACGPKSVWETLEHFKPCRIGHGVRSVEDPDLLDYLKEKKIHLEVCPSSNLVTGIYQKMSEHAADQLFHHGISMSINTDGRTISDTTLTREYELLNKAFHWQVAHFRACNLAAVEASFAPEHIKEKFRKVVLGQP